MKKETTKSNEEQTQLNEMAAKAYMEQYLVEAQENNVLRAQARHSMRLGTIEIDIIPTDKAQTLQDVMDEFSTFAELMQKLHGNSHLTLDGNGGLKSGAGEMHQ